MKLEILLILLTVGALVGICLLAFVGHVIATIKNRIQGGWYK